VARERTTAPGQTGLLARTLVAYPTAGALEAALIDGGLCAAEPSADVPVPLTVVEYLLASRCAFLFAREVDDSPVRHDTLAAHLVLLGARDLADVVFVEHAPAEGSDQPYQLHGYVDAVRYTTTARSDLGFWYDLDAVVGLVNAIARDRGKAQRWLLGAADGDDAIAVGGPEAALRDLVARDLLPLAERTGSGQAGHTSEQLLDPITDDAVP
jgi:hypothetical protein